LVLLYCPHLRIGLLNQPLLASDCRPNQSIPPLPLSC
jgi:hypothetical protein